MHLEQRPGFMAVEARALVLLFEYELAHAYLYFLEE